MMCRLYSHLRYANRWGTDQDTTLPAPGTGERGMDRWNEQAARQQFINNFADYFHDHLKQIAGDMPGLSGDELRKVGKEVEAEVNEELVEIFGTSSDTEDEPPLRDAASSSGPAPRPPRSRRPRNAATFPTIWYNASVNDGADPSSRTIKDALT